MIHSVCLKNLVKLGVRCMSDDTERLVAEVNTELKHRAKADPRNIREIVESSLEREFSTGATAAIERRIDEREQRIQTLKREIRDRERELAEERDELQRLKGRLEGYEEKAKTELEAAREQLCDTPKDVDNPAVKNWAKKLGMTPMELIEELE